MGLLSRLNIDAGEANRRDLLRLLEPAPDGRLLEVGPGMGNEAVAAGKIVRAREIHGIEWPGYGAEAEARGIQMSYCDLQSERWPFPDESFDVIFSNQVLEHMANTDHFFEEIRRLLKPMGYAVISTPNLSSWHNVAMLLCTLQPVHCWVSDRWCALGNPLSSMYRRRRELSTHSHLRIFTLRALCDMARAYEFQVEKVSGGSFGIPLIGGILARIDPWHSVYATIKVRKTTENR